LQKFWSKTLKQKTLIIQPGALQIIFLCSILIKKYRDETRDVENPHLFEPGYNIYFKELSHKTWYYVVDSNKKFVDKCI